MTISERCVRELSCDVQIAKYCLGTVAIDLAGVPPNWLELEKGHACPICARHVEVVRKGRKGC